MNEKLLTLLVRTRFALTSRSSALKRIQILGESYVSLAESVGPDAAARPFRVPPMLGVDDDMRDWSIYMILEHNAIVNRVMTAITEGLALGQEPRDTGVRDPKKDVMPSPHPGVDQIEAFGKTIEDHVRTVERLPRLRGTKTRQHPIFGLLDAHGWNCMFALHLDIHLKQANAVVHELGLHPLNP